MTFDELIRQFYVPLDVAIILDAATRDGATIGRAGEIHDPGQPCAARWSGSAWIVPVSNLTLEHWQVFADRRRRFPKDKPLEYTGCVFVFLERRESAWSK